MNTLSNLNRPVQNWLGLLLALPVLLATPSPLRAADPWTPLANPAPDSVNLMLLLSDGTVMAQQTGGSNWYRLTPINGRYTNGIWSTMPSMNDARVFYSSAVLRDGRLFVAGGEYGTGGAKAEIFDPQANQWTQIPVPAALLNPALGEGFLDSSCKILPDGKLLVAPVAANTFAGTLIYDPVANSWTNGPASLAWLAEATWLKLADDSILTVDPDSQNSERYIPALNQWVTDTNVPVRLYVPLPGYVGEIGGAALLADGRAFFLGGDGKTALYTPSGNNSPGTWAAGPDVPKDPQGNSQGAPDAPAAMMVNGKVLCLVSRPADGDGAGQVPFPSPSRFYEYDPIANAFTSVKAPHGDTENVIPFTTAMLALPDGNILFSERSSQLYVYRPDGPPLPAGKPTITRITMNRDTSYHLTGTKLNGISEGASYGDDAQMDSNYPLVRLDDGAGHIYYGRTYNWSSTSVQTGSQPVSTEFMVHEGLPPSLYSLVAVANGIASDPVSFFGPMWVDFNYTGVSQTGNFISPFKTLSQGRDNVLPSGTILIKGNSSTAETLTINKPMTLGASGGPATIGRFQ